MREGTGREVVNRIQKTRKKMGLNVDDRIKISFGADEELSSIIQEYRDYIAGEVLGVSMEALEGEGEHHLEVEGRPLSLTIVKV